MEVRALIRGHLRGRVSRIRHLAILAEQAADGPDPEAALVFLRMLRRRVDDALTR